jgi:flagellar basal-body rod modification protein FlgD
MDMASLSLLSPQEKAANEAWALNENRNLASQLEGRAANPNQNLGKEDFLKLLLTQLSNQDPTAPMEDKEFIAQMAQFSSLEQMTNMAADFSKMAQLVKVSEATGALGKTVQLDMGDGGIASGVVQAVTRDANPQILVNGKLFNWEQVTTVMNSGADAHENAMNAYDSKENN